MKLLEMRVRERGLLLNAATLHLAFFWYYLKATFHNSIMADWGSGLNVTHAILLTQMGV